MAIIKEASIRHLIATAEEISKELDRRKIAAVFLKGVALASQLYEEPGLRPFADIDLLATTRSIPLIGEALEHLGFRPEEAAGESMEMSYLREDSPGVESWIDLHWDFKGPESLQAAVRVPVSDILRRSIRTARGIPIPCHEDHLLLAAVNLVRSCADRLILVVDFAQLADRITDWQAVVDRATAWKVRTALWLALTLAERHAKAKIPPGVLQQISPSTWKQKRLLNLLNPAALTRPGKEEDSRYRYVFKALCLDSWGDMIQTLAATFKGWMKKTGRRRDP